MTITTTTRDKAGNTSQTEDDIWNLPDDSQSIDTQLIQGLQRKHLQDDSQVVILRATEPGVCQPDYDVAQPSPLVDKTSASSGQNGEIQDTQQSNIVDFGLLQETAHTTTITEDGQKESSLKKHRLDREDLHRSNQSSTSPTSCKGRASHSLGDQAHKTGTHPQFNSNTRYLRTYSKRPTTSVTWDGKNKTDSPKPENHSMDDWQPSAVGSDGREGSPTQKNNSLAYENIQIVSSPVPGPDDELPSQAILDATASARSYDENEIGGVRFSFTTSKLQDPPNHESSGGIDRGFMFDGAQLEPETPAPPENPFAKAKPPLQGTQLFNNTQSSPVDPHVLESGSSRPSPGMFGFGVQSSRNRVLSSVTDRFQHDSYHPPADLSSPSLLHLARSAGTNRSRGNQAPGHAHPIPEFTSPLHHLGDKTPRSAEHRGNLPDVDETPISRPPRSFKFGPISFKTSEPHEYVSREESQQRRLQKQAQAEKDSDSEEDSFEREQEMRMRQRKMREEAAKELAQVSVTLTPKREEEVEVPGTGQNRRSMSQEYIAQCFGDDARDTQSSHRLPSSVLTEGNTHGDTQVDDQANMTVVDSQIPNAAQLDSPSPSENGPSSRLETDTISAKDGVILTSQSNPPSPVSKPQGNEVSPPLPALDNGSDSESTHLNSSMTPSTRVPRTSSGRFAKSSIPQTPGRDTHPTVVPTSTREDMIPETSPVKSGYKLFDVDDSPDASIVSLGGIGFTQDDPEYDEIVSPIRGAAAKRMVNSSSGTIKVSSAIPVKSAMSKQGHVVFSGESSMANGGAPLRSSLNSSLPMTRTTKFAVVTSPQKLSSSAGNLKGDVDFADSSPPIRPASRRAGRKAHQVPDDASNTNQKSSQSKTYEGDAARVQRLDSSIHESIEVESKRVNTHGTKKGVNTTELLPCPFYSADKPCNMDDHSVYYHDDEIRQVYLRKHGVKVPSTSGGDKGSDIYAIESKTSVSLPSTQHSEKTERIASPTILGADAKPLEQSSEFAIPHDTVHVHSSSSSLSELPSHCEDEEFFTAAMDNDSTLAHHRESSMRDASASTTSSRSPSQGGEMIPPTTVRRKLSFPQALTATSKSKPGNEKLSTENVWKATGKTKGGKSRRKPVVQSSRNNSAAPQSSMRFGQFGDDENVAVERTAVPIKRPARSTRRASINYESATSSESEMESDSSKCSTHNFITKEPAKPVKVAAPHKVTNPSLFANMAFAISYKGDSSQDKADRTAVTRLITTHGGRLLDGFNELFTDAPTSLLTTPCTTSISTKPPTLPHRQIGELALASTARDLGFVAFIGDHYTRKSKFVQALALGLPCLSGRWVTACVSRGRIVPFLPFLLAAGESAYLGGAVRSRLLAPYDPSTARFEETFARREKLLGGKKVIFLMGRGKAEERKRAYLFLTRALGAGEVRRVASVKEAREVVEAGGRWDLVYVDDDKKVAGAEAEILGAETKRKEGGKTKGKEKAGKRKRSEETTTGSEGHDVEDGVEKKRVKVVGDEFVVQSLILGCLMDEG